ncbi:MAG: hypothetical protein LBE59_10205 [Nevskiaceae bacterium]|jgi:hypothetical protein|nr:hypothetical protein [Nevskiaceae bacterium]
MDEKHDSDEFEEDDDQSLDGDDQDLDRATRELELARRRSGDKSGGVPALRKLELLREQKQIAELTSDFDDYDLDERPAPPRERLRLR